MAEKEDAEVEAWMGGGKNEEVEDMGADIWIGGEENEEVEDDEVEA